MMSGDDLLQTIWGHGSMLGPLAMAVRATAMFFIALVLVRVGGARTFARRSSFDNVVVIMLGAIAARGVVGASPFFSTVAASGAVVGLHRLIGRLCVTQPWLGRLVQGQRVMIYERGEILRKNLQRTGISEDDLMESHRLERKSDRLTKDETAFLERNGRISFVVPEPSLSPADRQASDQD